MRLYAALSIIISSLTFIGCTKDHTGTEYDLYGTWTKGTQAGDTLQFLKKDNRNIMRINDSFNPGMPAYNEKEYSLRDGILKIKNFSPVSQDYYPIDSFTWIQRGSEFRILGFQLFMFMSSTTTSFTYRKI